MGEPAAPTPTTPASPAPNSAPYASKVKAGSDRLAHRDDEAGHRDQQERRTRADSACCCA